MAYIGVPPADRTSGARVRDEFTADGTQVCFQLSQEVPGSFESNIIAIVENVIQEPVSAYTIINTVTLSLTSISGTFTKNETVTGGTSAATGTVIQVNLSNIVVRPISGSFQNSEAISGGSSTASANLTAVDTNIGRGVLFSGTPTTGTAIYVLHQNSATYQLKPAAGSVTPETLSENLRTFTVDKFTATASQTQFTLSATPVSVKSILVFVDGVMQTETTHYTLSGAVVTMGSGLAADQQVTVVHLGFSTVSRTAFADGSITTAMIADGAITGDKIATGGVATIDMADGSVTSLKLANGGIATVDLADGAVTLPKLSATGTASSSTFLRGDNSWQVVAVTPTAVSSQANTATDYFALPRGTTVQRPGSPVAGMTRFNTTTGFPEWYSPAQTGWIQFNASGPSYTIDYLVVAGGGSGGDGTAGGAGGAGGYLAATSVAVNPSVGYNVIIGAGGSASYWNSNLAGNPGSNTLFSSFATAIGGGQGGSESGGSTGNTGKSGGSGGGGGRTNAAGGSGTVGQGNNGGSGYEGGGYYLGGGGGGANAAGANASGNQAGAGGAGITWLNGSTYAGGGGGAVQAGGGGFSGAGGAGGGGAGSQDNNNGNGGGNATSGTANTGGGGGGGPDQAYAGNGGSGVVIIRYSGIPKAAGGTITSAGGYTYHTFTSSGTFTG